MKAKVKILFPVFILLVLAWAGSSFDFLQAREDRPVIIFTNAGGETAEYFGVMDSVFGSFSALLPETRYTILVMRSDGTEISRSVCTSDQRGIIPTIALWGDIGVKYDRSAVGKLDMDALQRHTYRCILQHAGRTAAEAPIPVIPVHESGPVIYASGENGEPLKRFADEQENVFLTGKNFPPGAAVRIHVAGDRRAWQPGDRLEPLSVSVHDMTLTPRQRNFTTMIASTAELTGGGYDVIVEYGTVDGVFDRHDLLSGAYNAGFTVSPAHQARISELHMEAQLACQAPPQDPATGTVIGAPTPIYKNNFGANEDVWVAVDPYTGGLDYSNRSARLYVVDHQSEAGWLDGTALTDVSGGYESVVILPGSASVNYTRIWSSPAVRDAGYDVVVDFEPFGVYDQGQDIVDSLDAEGFIVPTLWVCLESISFNHDSSSSDLDAISIRQNRSLDVPVPEWVKAEKSYPAAYIKNKTITVQAVFSAAAGVTSADIRAVTQSGSLGDVLPVPVAFANGTSGTVSFQISADTPAAVQGFYQVWRWQCGNINASSSPEVHLADSGSDIFIVLAVPQAPWSTSGPRKPWADAIEKACTWASGETTAEGAAGKIAQQLFLNTGGLYDTYSGASSYTTNGGTSGFDLTRFLANIPNIGVVNCYDMGKSLVSIANAGGCGLSYRFSGPFGYLNCIYAIGRGWTNNPFHDNPSIDPNPIVPEDWSSADGRSGFGNHAFGSISDNIFDACLTVDTDSNPDYGPPFLETWMLDEPWSGYQVKVVDDNPPSTTAYPSTYTFSIK
jgi:hypothetical protein